MTITKAIQQRLYCYTLDDVLNVLHKNIHDQTLEFVIFWDYLRPTRTNWLTGQLFISQHRINSRLQKIAIEYPNYQIAFKRIQEQLKQKSYQLII